MSEQLIHRMAKIVHKPQIVQYAFTYNKNYKKDAVQEKSDYDVVLTKLNAVGKVITFGYGYGKQKRLHMHGIVEMHDMYAYPKYLKEAGMIYDLKPLTNRQGWLEYMEKNNDELMLWHSDMLMIMAKQERETEEAETAEEQIEIPMKKLF